MPHFVTGLPSEGKIYKRSTREYKPFEVASKIIFATVWRARNVCEEYRGKTIDVFIIRYKT